MHLQRKYLVSVFLINIVLHAPNVLSTQLSFPFTSSTCQCASDRVRTFDDSLLCFRELRFTDNLADPNNHIDDLRQFAIASRDLQSFILESHLHSHDLDMITSAIINELERFTTDLYNAAAGVQEVVSMLNRLSRK